jgi:hypothetical protein
MGYLDLLSRLGSVWESFRSISGRDFFYFLGSERTNFFLKIFARKGWNLLLSDAFVVVNWLKDCNLFPSAGFVVRCVALDH